MSDIGELVAFIEQIQALPDADREKLFSFMQGMIAARKLNDRA